jgi:hypothetical protein
MYIYIYQHRHTNILQDICTHLKNAVQIRILSSGHFPRTPESECPRRSPTWKAARFCWPGMGMEEWFPSVKTGGTAGSQTQWILLPLVGYVRLFTSYIGVAFEIIASIPTTPPANHNVLSRSSGRFPNLPFVEEIPCFQTWI